MPSSIRQNRIKAAGVGPHGYFVVYKRLERGTFQLHVQPVSGVRHVEVDAGELALTLEGGDLAACGPSPAVTRHAVPGRADGGGRPVPGAWAQGGARRARHGD